MKLPNLGEQAQVASGVAGTSIPVGRGFRTFLQNHLGAAAAALTLLFLIWQAVWAISTPAFRSPDEPQHVNSILRVAEGGGWPDPGKAYLSPSVLRVGHESGMISPNAIGFDVTDRTQLFERYSAETVPLFDSMQVTPHSERVSLEYTGYLTSQVDQMTQHPPVFYYIEAFVFRLFGAESWPWDRQILLMRLVSAAMTLPLIPSVIYTARKMGSSERAALGAGIMAFGVPQLAFITGAVTNDSLTIGLGSIVIAACAAVMAQKRGSWRMVLIAGLALGAALWTKGTAIPLGLTVALAFLANPRIGILWRRFVHATSAGLIGVAVGGAWWIRNIIRFGVIQPAGYQSADKGPGYDWFYLIRTALKSLITSYWGRFDWLSWWLPTQLIWALAITCAVLIGVAIYKSSERLKRLVLLSYTLSVSCLLVFQAWTQYRDYGIVAGVQGRYLFPGIAGILALVALAIDSPVLAKRKMPLIGLTGVTVAVAGFSWISWLNACYPGSPVNVARWAEVAGITTAHAWLAAFIGILVLAGTMALAAFINIGLVGGDEDDSEAEAKNVFRLPNGIARFRFRVQAPIEEGDGESEQSRFVLRVFRPRTFP